MYGKIFEQTFTGSMYGKSPLTFAVWSYIIANTKPDHRVELNPSALSPLFNVPEADVKAVIDFFCAPDPSSRSKQHRGKRLLREGQFIYFVTGHQRFRDCKSNDARREYMRNYMRRRRANAQRVSR
jgi:hypothetical protein